MKKIVINNYVTIYIQENEKVGLLSLPYSHTKTLSDLTTENDTTIVCKSNASLFNMSGDKGILGRNIGLSPKFEKINEAPNQTGTPRYDLAVFNDGSYQIGIMQSWDYRDNVMLSYSPKFVLVDRKMKVEYVSHEFDDGSGINDVNNYTYFGKLQDGRYFLVGAKQYRPTNLRDLLYKDFPIEFLVCNDGGGSAQVNLNGRVDFNPNGTQRAIPNAIMFYKDNEEPKPKYDFTSAKDLVRFAKDQMEKPNYYKLGGIGRYNSYGIREFDCTGIVKSFLFHNYSQNNTSFYNPKQDIKFSNYEPYFKDMNLISDKYIGSIVYLYGSKYEHAGIYIGNGQVIETTPRLNGVNRGKIIISQFSNRNKPNYREWDKWFMHPDLKYEIEEECEDKELILEVTKKGMRFRNKPMDTDLLGKDIPIGTKFNIIQIEEKPYSDGFQWAKVISLRGVTGYVQLDYGYVKIYGKCKSLENEELNKLKEKIKDIKDIVEK